MALIHIFAGLLAITAGAFALSAVKGGTLHRKAGAVFVGSTLAMATMGGIMAALAVTGDIRMIRAGSLQGTRRIARHLWRMCFAMFIATGSFFLGQAKVFPESIRILPLLAIPVVLVLLVLAYWLVRVGVMNRLPKGWGTPPVRAGP